MIQLFERNKGVLQDAMVNSSVKLHPEPAEERPEIN